MTRRISVSECPNCGAPVEARVVDDGADPQCQFCHVALPTVDDSPPPPTFTQRAPSDGGFQFQSFSSAPPPPSYVRRTKAKVVAWVIFAVVVAAVAAVVPLVTVHNTSTASSGSTGTSTADLALPGSSLSVGYDLRLLGHNKAVSVGIPSGDVAFTGTCFSTGKTVHFKVSFPVTHISVPAHSNAWYPSANPTSGSVYQKVASFPDLCGPGGLVVIDDSVSVTTSTPDADTGTPLDMRWHWRGEGSNGAWEGPVTGTL